MAYQTFETERLFLRPTTSEDAPFILELLNTPGWLQYIGDRQVRTVEDADNYIREKMLPQLERLGFSNYTLIRKGDGSKLGVCGLYDREGYEGIDIGFALLPAYEKQGFAFESANQLKEAAATEFGIDHLSAMTAMDNLASQRLLERLGFVQTGTTRFPDEEEDLLMYACKL